MSCTPFSAWSTARPATCERSSTKAKTSASTRPRELICREHRTVSGFSFLEKPETSNEKPIEDVYQSFHREGQGARRRLPMVCGARSGDTRACRLGPQQ